MDCRCSKKYVVTYPNGQTVERTGEREAIALAKRIGGSYKAK